MNNLDQFISEYTRVTKSTSTLLDVILTSNAIAHLRQCVFKFTLCDHYLVYTSIKDIHAVKEHRTIQCRSYKNFTKDDFIKDISDCSVFNASSTEDTTCVESDWALWKKCFTASR